MAYFNTQQRAVPVRLWTSAGWVSGTFHVPERVFLAEYLNTPSPILRLTDARLPGDDGIHAFFAAEKQAVALVVLGVQERVTLPLEGPVRSHPTHWLFPGGVTAAGRLVIHRGARVSDHIVNRSGFLVLSDVTLRTPSTGGGFEEMRDVPHVLIQVTHAVGVAEDEPTLGETAFDFEAHRPTLLRGAPHRGH